MPCSTILIFLWKEDLKHSQTSGLALCISQSEIKKDCFKGKRWVPACSYQSLRVLAGRLLPVKHCLLERYSFLYWNEMTSQEAPEFTVALTPYLRGWVITQQWPFLIFHLYIFTSTFHKSGKECFLFCFTPGMQEHNRHLSVNSTTLFFIILPFVYSAAENIKDLSFYWAFLVLD